MYKFIIPDIETKQNIFWGLFKNISLVLVTLINWLLKPKCMLTFFEIFFVVWKYDMNFFQETWLYAWKQDFFFVL
jgi:hypothetical protein